jgi:hypothetical protein
MEKSAMGIGRVVGGMQEFATTLHFAPDSSSSRRFDELDFWGRAIDLGIVVG